MEQLKIEYKVKEQRFFMDGDRGELQRIKTELRALADQEKNDLGEEVEALKVKLDSPVRKSMGSSVTGKGFEREELQTPPTKVKGEGGGGETDVARLEEEREELIATGVFDPAHPIIQELDRRIATGGQ